MNNNYANPLNMIGKPAGQFVKFKYPVYPLSFFVWYETPENKQLEYSNKMIAPQKLLQEIMEYQDIVSPYFFQFPPMIGVASIGKFIEGIDGIYLPERFFQQLKITPGTEVNFQLINRPMPRGRKITLKPKTFELLELPDPKAFLQSQLQFNYTALERGEVIILELPEIEISNNRELEITITQTEPDIQINITETDLEIEFQEPDNYQEYLMIKESIENEKKRILEEQRILDEIKRKKEAQNQIRNNFNPHKLHFNYGLSNSRPNQKNENQGNTNQGEANQGNNENKKDEFVPFSGSGNRLGSK